MRFSIVTFGCRVNQADSCRFEEELRARGGSVATTEEADLVVVNTCSVTASADQGSRQTIRRIARQNPNAKIVVTGCYATRSPEEVQALPGVVRLYRNDEKERLVDLSADLIRSALQSDASASGDGPCGALVEPGVLGRTAYPLRIQTGCDEPCSYCIIPTTRGAPRSLPIDRVLAEVDRLKRGGFREIILTGVHLGSYGRDLTPRASLIALLRELATIDDMLFRISSLEPMDCTDDIVDLVASNDAFAPHFHLPLQHASDRILKLMRRPYTLAFYRRLVASIRTLMPHASIGTDLIVGFPGETAEDFEILRQYLEDSPLTHLHVFPYSDRPGTAASDLRGKVGGIDIRERSAALRAIGQRLTGGFRSAQVGSIRPALTIDDGSVAVTDNYLKLRIVKRHTRNERIIVRVLTDTDPLLGDVVAQ